MTTDNTTLVFAIAALILFIVLIVQSFIQFRTITAVTTVMKDVQGNAQWMNTVEKAILQTVPAETLAGITKVVDKSLDLLIAASPNSDVADFATTAKQLADNLTDGKYPDNAAG